MISLSNYLDNFKSILPDKLTDMDKLVFARVASLPFHLIWQENMSEVPLDRLCTAILEQMDQPTRQITLPADLRLLTQLSESHRFSEVTVSRLVLHDSSNFSEQFGGMTFQLKNKQKVVVFRATEGTILGWQSDFEMALQTNLKSQQAASRYLDHELSIDDQSIRVIGYSKGGNLAAVSVAHQPVESHSKIIEVVSLDSAPSFESGSHLSKVSVTNIVPQLSAFGIIATNHFNQRSIQSNSVGIWQHDLYSWQADSDGQLIDMQGLTDFTSFIPAQHIEDIGKLSYSNKKKLLENLFSVFQQLDLTNISDVIKHWSQVKALIRSELKGLDPDVSNFANQLVTDIFNAILQNIR